MISISKNEAEERGGVRRSGLGMDDEAVGREHRWRRRRRGSGRGGLRLQQSGASRAVLMTTTTPYPPHPGVRNSGGVVLFRDNNTVHVWGKRVRGECGGYTKITFAVSAHGYLLVLLYSSYSDGDGSKPDVVAPGASR